MKTTHIGFAIAFFLSIILLAACGGSGGSSKQPNQSVSFSAAPTIVVGSSGTVIATASSGLPVNFTSSTPSVCTINVTTVTGLSTGTCIIAANQAGDATYDAATQVTQSITITATLSGKVHNIPSGAAFVLQNNLGDNITIPSGSTNFTFPTSLVKGGNYNVTVQTQPTNPAQNCTVSNGTGTVSTANVTNIIVDCSWVATGSLSNARFAHTATLLTNGKVLVTGGFSGVNDINGHPIFLSSAELYDPTTGLWTPTGSLSTMRSGHTATLLSNGKVLVVGGSSSNLASTLLASAELYDPITGLWTQTGSLANTRSSHTATLLPNGKVLVAGGASTIGNGNNNASFPISAELFDPTTGLWTPTGSLADGRVNHTATLLANGKLLVVGGNRTDTDSSGNILSVYLAKAEVYDSNTGLWTPTGSLANSLNSHTATLLLNGMVLVSGGVPSSNELYDPATGLWSPTGVLADGRAYHTATLLSSGKVLVAGGGGATVLAHSELYDPATGLWTPTGYLTNARMWSTATLLPNGKLLAVGGSNGNGAALVSAELYF